jgi:hypothetical protein
MAKTESTGKCPSCDAKLYGNKAECYRCGAKITPEGAAVPNDDDHATLRKVIREELTGAGIQSKQPEVLAPVPVTVLDEDDFI